MDAQTPPLEALRTVDLFAGLSKKSLGRVASLVRPVSHPVGKEVVAEGQNGAGFHLVTSGTAEVLVDGQRTGTLSVGDWFGDISLIDGLPRSATVRALEPMTTLSLPSWQFRPLLDEEPQMVKALLLVMCARLRAARPR